MGYHHGIADLVRHPLARFFGVLLACFVTWFVIYEILVAPAGAVDEWLSLHIAAATAGLLNFFGAGAMLDGRHVWLDGVAGILVVDSCNGLSSVGLFVAFVLAFPGPFRSRLWFIPLGILAIHIVNITRIAALLLIQANAPALFDPMHEIGLTVIFYTAIFGLWVMWVRMGDGGLQLRSRPVPQPA